MKMKFLSLFALVVFITTNSTAQTAQLKGGVNLANVSVTDKGSVDEAKMLTSFHVGFSTDIKLASLFSIQSGILFTGKGSKIQRGKPSDNGYFRQTSNPMYIEVPVNLVIKAPVGGGTKLFAGAGPYLGIGVAGKNKTEGRTFLGTTYSRESAIDFSNDDPTTLSEEEGTGFGIMKRFDYGLNGTAGVETKSVVLSLNYGLGLAKLQSGSNSSANENNKHRVLSFSLGFKL